MAVSTDSYFSNAIVGQPQVGADIDIHQVDLTPKYQVGFGFIRADGSKFRYGHFGADTNRGLLVATDISESSMADDDDLGATVANLTKVAGETMNPNAIGSHYMQLTITASAQQFTGGYVTVTDDNGEGYTYRIRSNTATGDPVTGDCYLELYKPIVVAVDSNSDFSINGCKFANLEAASTTDEDVAGITCAGMSSTNYGWIQTAGIAGVLQSAGTGSVGNPVHLSSNTSGAIAVLQSQTGISIVQIGSLVDAGDSGGHSVINVTLE